MRTFRQYIPTLPQLVISLFIMAANITPGIASGIKLQAFEADYSLHIEGLHVGSSKLTLTQSENLWRWQTSSKARGIYSLLSDKKPYSETTFSLSADRHLIHNILLSDEGDKNYYESALFDWQSKQAYIKRKNISSVATLNDSAYDYHSLIWLAANMINTGRTELTVDFYNKGEIVKSIVKRVKNQSIVKDGQAISAWVFEQTTEINNSRFRYYFDPAKPLIPLKIEKQKPGKKTTILLLKAANL